MASPAGPPPVSNPSEDDSTRILAATWTVTCVALITVITRLYVRLIVIRNWGWDDALMTLAISITVAGTAVITASIHYGAGKHLGDIPLQDLGMGLKLNFISQPMFLISICVVKLAVGASLLRIASTKFYKYLILSIMGFMTFYTVGCFFTLLFQCTDLRVLWDPTVHATCWTQQTLQALSYTNAALNILTDLLFALIIPAPMLWGLNVHRRTRISLLFILGLGVFACAAALVKVSYVVNYGKQGDWLWDSRDISIWTVVEDCTGIVAGSLPTLKPLFKRFLGSTYGKGSRKTPGGGYIQTTPKSNWESLSSAHGRARDPTDETSSERGFNTAGGAKQGMDEYEMGAHPGGQGNNWTSRTTVVANRDAESSDESLNRLGLPMGITKTTTTIVNSNFNGRAQ